MTFGEAIKSKRELLGMTQQDLAEKLFVSRQTVCRWENGARCPDLVMAKKISMVLGVSLDELISGNDLPDGPLEKEPAVDISCVKVMLTGIMLLLVAVFLVAADPGYMMGVTVLCFFGGIAVFIVGLLIPWRSGNAVIDEALPQRKCPRCGMEHDFDYPQCPHCGHSYYN